jgi:hypothetical protein
MHFQARPLAYQPHNIVISKILGEAERKELVNSTRCCGPLLVTGPPVRRQNLILKQTIACPAQPELQRYW